MRNKTNILFYLLYRFFIALIFFNALAIAQETPPEEFIVGTAIGVPDNVLNNETMQDTLNALELNTISFPANNNTQTLVSDYNLLAWNATSELEYIYHYSSSYYSKWEAEQNQTNPERIGFKHYDILGNTYGTTATWKGKECWSTIGLSAPTDFLMYGPHYRQDKKYKRWYTTVWEPIIQYVVRFNMALTKDSSVQDNEDVCKIKIVFRYKQDSVFYTPVLKSRILKVSDFNSDSSFKDIYLDTSPALAWYDYEGYIETRNLDKLVDPPAGTINYIDYEEKTGIQYCVEWLRNDDKCILYIDYVEVYDYDGWDEFIEDPLGVSTIIKNYADSIKTMGFTNIKYWGGVDEPSVIDAFIPVRTVNSILVDSAGAPPLINTFNPTWTWNHLVNGEMQMIQYIDIANPYEFLLAINPGSPDEPVLSFNQLNWLRYNFQLADSIHPDFWYAAQTHGLRTAPAPNGTWHIWRKPNPPELSAIVMLALAHGAKGIIFMWFDSYGDFPPIGSGTYWECIVKEDGTHLNTYPIVKDTLVPRLKGKLGTKLMGLNYTGDYIHRWYFDQTEGSFPDAQTHDYLTLGYGAASAHTMHWQCGFFDREYFLDDKYFFLVNLITNLDRSINVKVEPDDKQYTNYRFRNVEGYFDTSFVSQIIYQLSHPKGEGYLYEVAPVVKYGGKLIANDTVFSDISLIDNMTINNGKSIEINAGYKYTVNDTVALLGTGFITGDGYLERNTNGWIIINQWDKSVFKGRVGDHPKIQWGKHPSFPTVQKYKIWRNKSSAGWILVKEVSGSVYEWIDSAVTIIEGPPTANEVAAQYYVKASYQQGQIYMESQPSNTITYRRVEGSAWEKKNTGKEKIVYTYNLEQNYPNPFNPATTINYSLENSGDVELEIIDILGRRVALLVNEYQEEGNHSVAFNATNLSSGIYLYRIKSGKFVQTKKMLLLK